MRKSILQRKRFSRRKVNREFELQITSMMDMLIILLVFLLKSYAANSTIFSTSPNISLPTSTVEEMPVDAINLVIDPGHIIVDGEKVIDFKVPPGMTPEQVKTMKADQATYEIEQNLLGDNGRKILPLSDALMKAKEKAELLMSKAVWKDEKGQQKDPPKFQGVLIIHADKSIRYEIVRKIMYTAGGAEFKIFKLVTVRKEAS